MKIYLVKMRTKSRYYVNDLLPPSNINKISAALEEYTVRLIKYI